MWNHFRPSLPVLRRLPPQGDHSAQQAQQPSALSQAALEQSAQERAPSLSNINAELRAPYSNASATAFSPDANTSGLGEPGEPFSVDSTHTSASAAFMAARLEAECARVTMFHRSPAFFGYDKSFGWWMTVREWMLPSGLNQSATTLIITLPFSYPRSPPSALFVPRDLGGKGWTLDVLLPFGNEPATLNNSEKDATTDIFALDANTPHDRRTETDWHQRWMKCGVPLQRWSDTDDADRLLASLFQLLEGATRLSFQLSWWRDSQEEISLQNVVSNPSSRCIERTPKGVFSLHDRKAPARDLCSAASSDQPFNGAERSAVHQGQSSDETKGEDAP